MSVERFRDVVIQGYILPLGGSNTLSIYENAARFCIHTILVVLCLVDLDIFQGVKEKKSSKC